MFSSNTYCKRNSGIQNFYFHECKPLGLCRAAERALHTYVTSHCVEASVWVHVWVTDLEPALPTNKMLEYFIAYFVGIICFLAADIILTSSLDGTQAACPGEVITYTCTALRTNAIEWIVTPGVPSAAFLQEDTITERIIGDFQLALTIAIPNGNERQI